MLGVCLGVKDSRRTCAGRRGGKGESKQKLNPWSINESYKKFKFICFMYPCPVVSARCSPMVLCKYVSPISKAKECILVFWRTTSALCGRIPSSTPKVMLKIKKQLIVFMVLGEVKHRRGLMEYQCCYKTTHHYYSISISFKYIIMSYPVIPGFLSLSAVLISATAKFFNTNLPVRQEPGNQPSPWDHQSDIDNLQNIIGGSESPPPNSHSPLSDQGHEAIEALPEATSPNDAPPLRGLESKHHTDDHTTHYNSKQRDLYVLDKIAAVEAETRPTHTTPSQYQAVLDVEIPTQPLFSLSDHNSIGMRTSPPESLSIKNGESITERGKPSDESNLDLDKDAEAIVEAIPVEDTSPRDRRPAAGEAIFAEPRPLSPAHITSPFIQVSARGLCLHLSCPFTASPEGKLRWFVNDRRVRRGTRGYDFVDKESLLVCREAGLSGAVDVICRAQNVIGIDTRQAMVDMSSKYHRIPCIQCGQGGGQFKLRGGGG